MPTPTRDLAHVQRRTVSLLVGTQILGGVGVAVGIAVGALLLDELTGGPTLAGIGSAASVIGGALLAIPIVRVTNRYGRRYGLGLAYAMGVIGALVIVAAVHLDQAPLAFLGMLGFGGGTAANLQARYAAVDLATPSSRARQLSVVVWATTVGSVAGPSLAPLVDDLMVAQGGPRYAGPFIGSAIGFLLAGGAIWLLLRPDPFVLATATANPADSRRRPGVSAGLRIVGNNPAARLGIASVAVGHLVMVAVMTMTPVHIKHGLADPGAVTTVVGVVLSLHIAGMYALSPVAGLAADRWGPRPVILTGIVLLLAACGTAGTAGHDHVRLAAGLVLLGLGWSATMVAGSVMLTGAVDPGERPAVQGLSDLVMGIAGAAAGAVSGLVVDLTGYPILTLLAALAVVPVTVLVLRNRSPQPTATEQGAS